MRSSPFTYQQPYAAYPPAIPNYRRVAPANPFYLQGGHRPASSLQSQAFSQPTYNNQPAYNTFAAMPRQNPYLQQGASPQKTDITTQAKKPKVHPIGYLFPIMTMVGTPLMLASSLLGVHPGKKGLEFTATGLFNKLATYVGPKIKAKSIEAFKDLSVPVLKKMYSAGKITLALGIIPKTIIGILYGIRAQQPSILFSHLLQLPLTPLILKDNPIATSLAYLMGGLFTLGFINDVENGQLKDGLKNPAKGGPRLYDMTRFKNIFSGKSGLSLGDRISSFFSETIKMSRFVLDDHIRTTQRAFREVGQMLRGQKNDLTDTKSTGSTSKSSLGFLLCYMATIPSIVTTMLKPQGNLAHWVSKYSMATTVLSGLMLNFGMMLVALSGKNWAERIPLVGTSMELSGTVAGYAPNNKIQPFALALQQFGAGLNNIFFANKAQDAKSP
jgi:hypothetical protein